jgi:hypothetical protein
MAEEYRQLAREKGESASELFREIFTYYKQQKLQRELTTLQEYGSGQAREMKICEEEIDYLVFGDR